LLRAVELAVLPAGGALAVQGGVEPLLGELLADTRDGHPVEVECLGDAVIGPAVRAVAIGTQQDEGASAGVSRMRAGVDDSFQHGSLLGAQMNLDLVSWRGHLDSTLGAGSSQNLYKSAAMNH